MDEREARMKADNDFGINVALLALTNKFEFSNTVKTSLANEIKKRLLTGGREFIQEIGQQVTSNFMTDRPWDDGIKEAGITGGLLGLFMGGSPNPNININVTTQKEIIDLVNQLKKNQKGFAKLPGKEEKLDSLAQEAGKYKSAEVDKLIKKYGTIEPSQLKVEKQAFIDGNGNIIPTAGVHEKALGDLGYVGEREVILPEFLKKNNTIRVVAGGEKYPGINIQTINPLTDLQIKSVIDASPNSGSVFIEYGKKQIDFTYTDKIKLKSQLTDIFNQSKAVGEVKPRVVEPGEKTIEEFNSEPNQLKNILEKYKNLRAGQEAKYTEERAPKFAQVANVYTQGAGWQGYLDSLGKLKGEMTKVDVPEELQKALESFIASGKADVLFNKVQTTPFLTTPEKVSAQAGLVEIFAGRVPAQNQLDKLELIFGTEFVNSLKNAEPWRWNLLNITEEINGTLKILLSGMGDMSAVLNQGIFYTLTHPIKAVKLVGTSAKGAVSQKFYDAVNNQITKDKLYPILKRFDVPLRDMAANGNLSKADEAFLVRFINNAPTWTIVPPIIRASNRAFNVFMNQATAQTFYSMAREMLNDGLDPLKDTKAFKYASNLTGDLGGRANLGKFLKDSTAFLNLVGYSPRLQVSNIRMLFSPILYARAPKAVRKELWRALLSFLGMVLTVLNLAKLMGAEVELSPLSTDFAKIKVGSRRWNPAGRMQPYIRFAAQFLIGKTKDSNGKISKMDRWTTLWRFLETKASPLIGTSKELLTQKNFNKEDVTVKNFAFNHFLSMVMQDVSDAAKEVPWIQALITTGIPSFFGMGTLTYGENKNLKTTRSIKDINTGGKTSKTSTIKPRTKRSVKDIKTGKK
jgi:hypothetical protein